MAFKPAKTPRIGGMALVDGVYMRTDRAWAIARSDGTIERGRIARNPFAWIPVLRMLWALSVGMVRALSKAFSRSNSARPHTNRRFIVAVIAIIAADYILATRIGVEAAPAIVQMIWGPILFFVVLAAMKLLLPHSLWRYHGAEHKAIAAWEAGIDIGDVDAVMKVSPIHDRCGTNLVFWLIVLSALPVPDGWVGWVAPFLTIGVVAEILGFLARRAPGFFVTRLLLAGGRWLQKTVTIDEPTETELNVGIRALSACLAEHNESIQATNEPVGA